MSAQIIFIIVALLIISGVIFFFLSKRRPTPSSHNTGDQTQVLRTLTPKPGLQIDVLTEGSGTAAQHGKTVTVHYTGWLTNGKQFDSSIGRGPFSFYLGGGKVIKGWDEGVKGMKVGEKRKLTIDASLGYGTRGAGNLIPPNATLIFEVELISIK